MILVALGSNLPGPWGEPEAAVRRALGEIAARCGPVIAVSRLLRTSAFGRRNQPDFVNAVARIDSHLPPDALMHRLHAIERAAGRRRQLRWGPRTLDLDLLDYHGLVRSGAPGRLSVPHPGIAERPFVLVPLAEVAPGWRHPVTRLSARDMLARRHRRGQGGDIVEQE